MLAIFGSRHVSRCMESGWKNCFSMQMVCTQKPIKLPFSPKLNRGWLRWAMIYRLGNKIDVFCYYSVLHFGLQRVLNCSRNCSRGLNFRSEHHYKIHMWIPSNNNTDLKLDVFPRHFLFTTSHPSFLPSKIKAILLTMPRALVSLSEMAIYR